MMSLAVKYGKTDAELIEAIEDFKRGEFERIKNFGVRVNNGNILYRGNSSVMGDGFDIEKFLKI